MADQITQTDIDTLTASIDKGWAIVAERETNLTSENVASVKRLVTALMDAENLLATARENQRLWEDFDARIKEILANDPGASVYAEENEKRRCMAYIRQTTARINITLYDIADLLEAK